MRVVIVGASELGVETAKWLIAHNHEIIIVEVDKAKIDEWSDELDCGFLHGDGSKPEILRETGPKQTDVLFCLTHDDKANIIAGLVGKSLGFHQIVTTIEDPALERICRQLGLRDTVIPTQTISRYLSDYVELGDVLELSTLIKGEARFFSFTVGEEEAGKTIGELELPENARAICYYRQDKFYLTEDETKLQKNDEVVIITHSKNLGELEERWRPASLERESGEEQERGGK